LGLDLQKVSRQDSSRNTHALEHGPSQKRVSFLPQVDREQLKLCVPTQMRQVLGGQAESASSKVDIGRVELDTSLHNTIALSELASVPTESIDASGLWYNVEEGCHIEELVPGLGSHE
jgi:hypothetical protein